MCTPTLAITTQVEVRHDPKENAIYIYMAQVVISGGPFVSDIVTVVGGEKREINREKRKEIDKLLFYFLCTTHKLMRTLCYKPLYGLLSLS